MGATSTGLTLVTGATGHLGANLVRRLLELGLPVRVLVRGAGPAAAIEGLQVERVDGDLRDPAACARAVAGVTHVHHCAALVSTLEGDAALERALWETNVLGTRNLLRAAREAGVRRVVYTGSLSAVGEAGDEAAPFDPFARALPYAHTKALAELECLRALADGLPVVIATSCAILGPNDHGPSRMGRLVLDFARGRVRAYIAGGFEFVAARDMVEGHLLCMEKGRPGQKYIFASGWRSVDELFDILERVTGRRRPRLRLPAPLMALAAAGADVVLPRLFPRAERRFTRAAVRLLRAGRRADTTKARVELGFRPTSIEAALDDAHACFVRRGLLAPRAALAGATLARA